MQNKTSRVNNKALFAAGAALIMLLSAHPAFASAPLGAVFLLMTGLQPSARPSRGHSPLPRRLSA